MTLNLRQIREAATRRNEDGKAKPITRADLAAAMSKVLDRPVHETQIARYEEDGSAVPLDLLMAWLRCLGTTLEEQMLLSAQPVAWGGLDVDDPYRKLHSRLDLLGEYLSDGDPAVGAAAPELLAAAENTVRQLRRKPNVALLGAFDAGKSTLVNWLLGEDSLPTRYQPATAVVTFVRHSDDKPAGLAEDVLLLDEGFDPAAWDDLDHLQQHKVIAGGLGTLRKYGLNEADTSVLRSKPAFALVFATSPVLRSCNLIDNPGLSHDEDDTRKAYSAFRYMDVLLYASTATGFLNGADIAVLKDCLKHLPAHDADGSSLEPLAHLYIVATHAAPHLQTQLDEICDGGARRLYRELKDYQLPARERQTGRPVDAARLRQRVFTFWKELPTCCERLAEDLCRLLGTVYPEAHWHQADSTIQALKQTTDDTLALRIKQYEQVLADTENAKVLYAEKLAALGDVETEAARLQREVQEMVARFRQETMAIFDGEYHRLMQPERLADVIKTRYPGDDGDVKRDAQQNIGSHVVGMLGDLVTRVCAERLEQLGPLMDEHINFYEKLTATGAGQIVIPFDAKGAFAMGIASAGTASALSLAALAAGNLGGYVLVAHGVGLLGSLGIGLNAASVMGIVSAVGGPITLGIGIAVAAAFFGKKYFGEDWQLRLARQVIKQLGEQQLQTKMHGNINDIWDGVLASCQAACDAMHQQYVATLKEMNEQLAAGPEKRCELERLLQQYKQAKDFFARMPWF